MEVSNNNLFGLPLFGANLGIILTVGMPITFHHPHTIAFGKAYLNHCLVSDHSLNSPREVATRYDSCVTHGLTLNLYPYLSRLFRMSTLKKGTISSLTSYPSQWDFNFVRPHRYHSLVPFPLPASFMFPLSSALSSLHLDVPFPHKTIWFAFVP